MKATLFILSVWFFFPLWAEEKPSQHLFIVDSTGLVESDVTEKAQAGFFANALLNEGIPWDGEGTVHIPDGKSMLIDFGAEITFVGLTLQADNNDIYGVESVEIDGVVKVGLRVAWKKMHLVNFGETFEFGMRGRYQSLDAPVKVRYLLITPTQGDKFYSVSALKAYLTPPEDWRADLVIGPIWTQELKEEVEEDALRYLSLIVGFLFIILGFLATQFWLDSQPSDEWQEPIRLTSSKRGFGFLAIVLTAGIALYWLPLFRFLLIP